MHATHRHRTHPRARLPISPESVDIARNTQELSQLIFLRAPHRCLSPWLGRCWSHAELGLREARLSSTSTPEAAPSALGDEHVEHRRLNADLYDMNSALKLLLVAHEVARHKDGCYRPSDGAGPPVRRPAREQREPHSTIFR